MSGRFTHLTGKHRSPAVVSNTDVVMPIYNLIEYSDNYSKTSGSLWQYYRDEPFTDDNGTIVDIPNDPDSASFKHKK